MENITNNKERHIWIDWMKVIGIYFIVLGHFFPNHYEYIYVFNVPVFFIISGYLSKKESSNNIFLKKTLYNLFIPMFLMSFLNHIYINKYDIINNEYNILSFYEFIYGIIKGNHPILGACWYIYALIILKILFQYTPFAIFLTIAFLSPFISLYLNNNLDYIYRNYIAFNIFLSCPLYAIGIIIKKYSINMVSDNKLKYIFILSLILAFFCGKYNGEVWLYQNGYGKNILLFFIGAVSGTFAIFAISKFISNKIKFPLIKDISNSTILIMGLHWNILQLFYKLSINNSFLPYIYSFIIIALFIPVWYFCRTYIPLLVGIYKIKK